MTPILFSDAATDYSTQGLGALADALSCKVTEELNGEYELQMTYPVSGRRYADIKNRCIIYCKPDPYRGGQPFRIYRITRPLNGVITVYARHISYDLSGIPVNPFTAGSAAAAMAGLKSNSAVSDPFTFWTNLGTTADFSVAVPSSIRSMLGGSEGSILDTYGGEYEWDGMTVRLYSQRGQDNGVRIAYGKNLTDIEQDENIANLATGVFGYWAGTDGTLVQTSVVNAPGTYNFTRVITVDFSSDFEAQPTTEQLQQRTQQYVQDNDIGVPDVSITVSWIQLEQYSGYEGLSLLERGCANLLHHVETIRRSGVTPVVCLNRFYTDTEAELALVRRICEAHGVRCAVSDHWRYGGAGAEELAQVVLDACEEPSDFRLLYPDELPLRQRVERIAREVYGADGVDWSPLAAEKAARFESDPQYAGYCTMMVKTHLSLSHDPALKGVPTGWRLPVRDVLEYSGARFLCPVAGGISMMPGTGSDPAYRRVDIDTATGEVTGLF